MSGSPIKKFEIHLEHDIDEQYQYEPGEMLRGEVHLANTEEIRVCSVEIQIRGEATVSWDNETGGDGQQFSARETYMDTSVELPLTADQGGPATGQRRPGATGGKTDAVTFPRGDHSFPLEIALPATLPSSFIGKYGSITYVLKATVREDKVASWLLIFTPPPIGERSIVMSVCVCVCVCVSARDHIFGTTRPIFTQFWCMLPMAVARSSLVV